jgi:MFS family permease
MRPLSLLTIFHYCMKNPARTSPGFRNPNGSREPQSRAGAQAGPPAPAWPLRKSMGVVTLAWVFGAVWMNATAGTPLTLFAQELGASNFQYGLLTALPFVASLVSLPASLLIERTGRRKGVFLGGLYLQRAMWFPIALAPLWLLSRAGHTAPGQATSLLLGLMFLMYAAGAFGGPAWVSWMADIVPERLRGRYFSRRRQWGNLLAVPAALLVGWLLDRLVAGAGPMRHAETLRWCALIFMGSAVFGLADISLFQPLPENPRKPQTGSRLLKSLAEPLKNRQFLLLSTFVATLTFAVSVMGQFVTLYLIEKVRVDDLIAQIMLLVVPMIAQSLVLPAWGQATDRMGKKPVLTIAALGLIPAGLGWCCLTDGNPWLGYVLSAAGTVLWTGVDIANFNLVLEMSDRNTGSGGSAYFAVNSVIINVAGCLGGLAAGVLATGLGDWAWRPIIGGKTYTFYDVLFAGSGLLRLAAVIVFLPLVKEPAARAAGETFRFMCAQIRTDAFKCVRLPLTLAWGRRLTPAAMESIECSRESGRNIPFAQPDQPKPSSLAA